jgi:hypothetical protein
MLLYEINPFIRYANKSEFSPINDDVITYDCRLFYVFDGNCKIYIEYEKHIAEKGTLMLRGSRGRSIALMLIKK